MGQIRERLISLLKKQNWSEEEKQWLSTYLESTDNSELRDIMLDYFEGRELPVEQITEQEFGEILEKVHGKIDTEPARKGLLARMPMLKIAAAASVVGIVILSALYFRTSDKNEVKIAYQKPVSKEIKEDVLPGGDKAVLTLADGSTIILDDAKNGALAQQGNTKVIKISGKLEYNQLGDKVTEIVYNKISTPRGGQYQIELPDGSQVWLNSASTLRFPTAFAGKSRNVEITGEAYFEIAKDSSMPFIVSVNSSKIEVLGTHFNVMAYKDEDEVKTTLLEGAVKFVNGKTESRLVPGQQSVLASDGSVKVLNGVNVNEVVAWKNGKFYFESADIHEVMKQLERWYDVEVIYQKKKTGDLLHAEIPRNTKLSDVLKVFDMAGSAKFEIQGKKIIVK